MNILFTNEFNKIAGVDQFDSIPGPILAFRKSLVLEELEELQEAIVSNDKIEQLDALADSLVVASGWLYVSKIDTVSINTVLLTTEECLDLIHCVVDGINSVEELPSFIFSAALSLGFTPSVLLAALHEVHRSNMSKFCYSETEAKASVNSYTSRGVITYFKQVGDVFITLRKSDDKILKGVNYSAPQLKALL